MIKIQSLLIVTVFSIAFIEPASALFGGLKEEIQKELDGNPFLEQEQIKLRVADEKNGYVTIEMYEGSRELRKLIDEGANIDKIEGHAVWKSPSKRTLRSANAIKKALAYVRKMKGVKEVILDAAVNTPADRAEDIYKKADSLYKQKNYTEALPVLRQAADLGNVRAQNMLGVMYSVGKGVTQDDGEALKWYRKAVEQGDATAQGNLGSMYRQGQGVTQDYGTAVKWYRKAAEQGDAKAQNSLAWLYATSSNSKYQNGRKAVAYAKQAVSKKPEKWYFVSTLAAAYARNGEFDKGVTTAKKAISLLQKEKRYTAEKRQKKLEASNERLELYRQRQPYTATKGH